METELQYLTPIFDKEPKYCECENCNGTGQVENYQFDTEESVDGPTINCERCDGAGWLKCD